MPLANLYNLTLPSNVY